MIGRRLFTLGAAGLALGACEDRLPSSAVYALVDVDGQPQHQDAAAPAPGLWYLGLRWLIRRRSSILFGFPDDAATIADAVRAHLDT